MRDGYHDRVEVGVTRESMADRRASASRAAKKQFVTQNNHPFHQSLDSFWPLSNIWIDVVEIELGGFQCAINQTELDVYQSHQLVSVVLWTGGHAIACRTSTIFNFRKGGAVA